MSKFKLKRRRHRRRRNSKKQFVIISVCLFVFVFILGTAYSAFSTNLSINANGSIKEHTYMIEDLKSLVVTSGDGLYEDETAAGRYIYKGGDPDNYILLGDDLFRIIAIEIDGTLKVVSNESIGSMVYDPGYSTAIDGVTEASSMEGTRWSSNSSDYCYNSSSITSYYGCNAWGSNETTLDINGNVVTSMSLLVGDVEYYLPSTEAYINTYLNGTYYNSLDSNVQSIIEKHLFNVGPVDYSSSQKLLSDIEQEERYKWKGNVGLINLTDYVKATTNTECTGAYAYYYFTSCYSTSGADNWMNIELSFSWTMSPSVRLYDSTDPSRVSVWDIYSGIRLSYDSANHSYDVYPVMYLSSSIVLKNDGTYDSPYEVVY